MKLNFEKLDESFWLLGTVLPLGDELKRSELQKKFGTSMPLDQFLNVLMKSLFEICKQYPEQALGFLDFIKQAIEYSLEEREKLPEVDYDPEEVKRLYKIRNIQVKKNE